MNINDIKIGEEVIYHTGNLAEARSRRQTIKDADTGKPILTKDGKVITELTPEAQELDILATMLFEKSTTRDCLMTVAQQNQGTSPKKSNGTGEFELYQRRVCKGKHIIPGQFEYCARRIRAGQKFSANIIPLREN